MKTPIQELIDEMTYMLTEGERSIYALREKARKLLENEKELLIYYTEYYNTAEDYAKNVVLEFLKEYKSK